MMIYLLTFYLFDDIEKNIEITPANHSAPSKGNFDENDKNARAT